jgi:methylthioribose-1-phosphate isomerase
MKTMEWQEGCLVLIDQTRLPIEETYVRCESAEDVADAIRTMKVRGAPAIGASAAYGLALAAVKSCCEDRDSFIREMAEISEMLAATRPTAVNLFWALNRMTDTIKDDKTSEINTLKEKLVNEAHSIFTEDIEMNRNIGKYGNEVVPQGARILTHCNAGALATAGYGTALGVIRAAHEAGKNISVYADETRPLLQGARLTAWELMQDNIPVTLITDNMAGYLMKKGMIDFVVVGADRITANGDVANKIGTYSVAVLCKEHNIPFYVAAPASTIDLNLQTGDEIPIEERESIEVTTVFGTEVAPKGIKVFNPAFDVTPNHMITGIITDCGIVRAPYTENLETLFKDKK